MVLLVARVITSLHGELFIRVFAMRSDWFRDAWNGLHFLLTLFWTTEALSRDFFLKNPALLELLQVMRAFRGIQLIKRVRHVATLHAMTSTVKARLPGLGWAVIMLLPIAQLLSMFLNHHVVLRRLFLFSRGHGTWARIRGFVFPLHSFRLSRW